MVIIHLKEQEEPYLVLCSHFHLQLLTFNILKSGSSHILPMHNLTKAACDGLKLDDCYIHLRILEQP